VINRSNLDHTIAEHSLQELLARGEIISMDNEVKTSLSPQGLIATKAYWEQLKHHTIDEVNEYHQYNPLKRGIPREELKSRLKLSTRLFTILLHRIADEGELEDTGTYVRRSGYAIQFNTAQQRDVDNLLTRFKATPFSPPTAKECISEVGEELYSAMIETGLLVPIPPEVVFRKLDYDRMVTEIRDLLKNKNTITAAEVRDHFNTSRRYVLALLEYLDAQGITVREGDSRRLK
jgi:selenocysteine-specific elongation factor